MTIEKMQQSVDKAYSKTINKFWNIIDDSDKYPSLALLRYKYLFKESELNEIYDFKISSKDFDKLNLLDEVGEPLLYYLSEKAILNLVGSYDLIMETEYEELNDITNEDYINGFIFSEIENSLAIEGVRSTRKKIEKIKKLNYSDLKDQNEIIVKNMLEAYDFIQSNKISEKSIFELYQILSKDCLKSDELLLDGNYYRHDIVHIVGANGAKVDSGVKHTSLSKMMKSLVDYINADKEDHEHLFASHIIHYYLVYLHPYFDYNGRMARVLSLWYSLNNIPSFGLFIISEAINNKNNKRHYYQAIKNSRSTHNDITYFIEYMSNIIISHTIMYINFYNITYGLLDKGEKVTNAQKNAIKTALIIPKIEIGYFDWKVFKSYDNDNFNKAYYLRLLNDLVKLKVLSTKMNKNAKLFILNYKKLDLI